MRKRITAAQAVMASLAFMVAILVAGPLAQAQDLAETIGVRATLLTEVMW